MHVHIPSKKYFKNFLFFPREFFFLNTKNKDWCVYTVCFHRLISCTMFCTILLQTELVLYNPSCQSGRQAQSLESTMTDSVKKECA